MTRKCWLGGTALATVAVLCASTTAHADVNVRTPNNYAGVRYANGNDMFTV